jgi:hypothetical protein
MHIALECRLHGSLQVAKHMQRFGGMANSFENKASKEKT